MTDKKLCAMVYAKSMIHGKNNRWVQKYGWNYLSKTKNTSTEVAAVKFHKKILDQKFLSLIQQKCMVYMQKYNLTADNCVISQESTLRTLLMYGKRVMLEYTRLILTILDTSNSKHSNKKECHLPIY